VQRLSNSVTSVDVDGWTRGLDATHEATRCWQQRRPSGRHRHRLALSRRNIIGTGDEQCCSWSAETKKRPAV
jgi:hypothetical protein